MTGRVPVLPGRGRFGLPTLFLAASLSLLAGGCSRDYPPLQEEPAPPPSGERQLAVVIRLPGDDFAGEQELRQRDAIARRIEERGLGEVILKGTGMGRMEVVFRAAAEGDLRDALREIMLREAPGRTYSLEERREPLQRSPSPAQ